MIEIFSRIITGALTLSILGVADMSAHEPGLYFQGERIFVDAKINQKPVRFTFDTGSDFSVIFRSTAERLKIKTKSTRKITVGGHPVEMGSSEPLSIEMFGKEAKGAFNIFPVSRASGMDGLLSWRNLTVPFLLIDGYDRKITTPKALPENGWQHWKLEEETRQLFFKVTRDGKPMGRVFVDTGSGAGLRLAPSLWKTWREKHPDAGVSLEASRYMVGDVMVNEIAWADEYRLGDLTFLQVDIGPISGAATEKGEAIDGKGKPYLAMIGARALRNLRLLISRQSQEILTQPVSPIPQHNRLGTVFLPEPEGKVIRVGPVAKNSPADRAGLKKGDVLLEIDGIDFSAARPNTQAGPSRFLKMPAGTALKLKVEREGKIHEIPVVLENLLRSSRTPRK